MRNGSMPVVQQERDGRLPGQEAVRLVPSLVRSLVPVGATLLVYVALRFGYFRVLQLPEAVYFAPSFLLEALRGPQLWLALIPGLLLFLRYRSLGWGRIEEGRAYRLLCAGTALILAYALSTYDLNFFYDRAHLTDRLLVAAAALLVLVHPAFIGPFVVAGLVTLFQLAHPLGGLSLTGQRVLFELLILFQASLLVHTVHRHDFRSFLLLAVCLYASGYFVPGAAKLAMGWVHNDVANLVASAYLNGWFPGAGQEAVLALAGLVRRLNPVVVAGTMALELSALLVFAARRLLSAFLIGVSLFHLGVFALSGIFFWRWILLDLVLLLVLGRLSPVYAASCFGPRSFCFYASVPIILLSSLYFRPPVLAWFDTPLTVAYDLEVVGESGAMYPVSRQFMAPYDKLFGQNRFDYLRDAPELVGTYGAVMRADVAARIAEAQDGAAVAALERELGVNAYSEERAARFDAFVRQFFAHHNRHPEARRVLGPSLGRLLPLWLEEPPNFYRSQERAEKVQVHYRKTYFTGDALMALADTVLRVIEIPE